MSPTLEQRWTPEMVADLRRGIAFGLSAREVAAEMGITRNAVIGKAKRLHLSLNPKPIPKPPASRIAVPKPPEVSAVSAVSAPLIEIWDLTDFTCRWPVAGDHPPFWYCGAPTTPREGVYCPCHRRLNSPPSRSSPG